MRQFFLSIAIWGCCSSAIAESLPEARQGEITRHEHANLLISTRKDEIDRRETVYQEIAKLRKKHMLGDYEAIGLYEHWPPPVPRREMNERRNCIKNDEKENTNDEREIARWRASLPPIQAYEDQLHTKRMKKIDEAEKAQQEAIAREKRHHEEALADIERYKVYKKEEFEREKDRLSKKQEALDEAYKRWGPSARSRQRYESDKRDIMWQKSQSLEGFHKSERIAQVRLEKETKRHNEYGKNWNQKPFFPTRPLPNFEKLPDMKDIAYRLEIWKKKQFELESLLDTLKNKVGL